MRGIAGRIDAARPGLGLTLTVLVCQLGLGCRGAIQDAATQRSPADAPDPASSPATAGAPASAAAGSGAHAPEGAALPACDAAQRGRSETEMRRLTTPEIVRSLRAVFGPLMDAVTVAERVPSLPAESAVTDERAFDTRIRDVESLEALASALAQRMVSDPAAARAVLDCEVLGELPRCRAALLDRVLRRLFRRPLGTDERASYEMFIDDIGGVDGLQWALVRAIVSPHFHQHLELDSTPAGDGRRRIDPFAAASRVAFALTGTLPDETLLGAAESGALTTLAALRAQAERLLETDGARDHLRTILLDWLAISPPDPAPAAALALDIDGAGLGEEARGELARFIDYVVFERRGSFRDLWTDAAVFPATERLATLLGVSRADGPVPGAGAPRGLFLRPASLLTSATDTSPIVRGAGMRRKLLCEVFPTPDPALVAAGNAVRDALPAAEHSGRERSAAATAGPSCAGCHGRINPVGFVLESFGPIGEWRERQLVLDDQGDAIASFAVDAHVDDVLIDDIGPVAGVRELGAALASNPSATRCYAQRMFASSRLRPPGEQDACLMRELVEAAPTRPVLDVLVDAVVNDDVLYRAEVVP